MRASRWSRIHTQSQWKRCFRCCALANFGDFFSSFCSHRFVRARHKNSFSVISECLNVFSVAPPLSSLLLCHSTLLLCCYIPMAIYSILLHFVLVMFGSQHLKQFPFRRASTTVKLSQFARHSKNIFLAEISRCVRLRTKTVVCEKKLEKLSILLGRFQFILVLLVSLWICLCICLQRLRWHSNDVHMARDNFRSLNGRRANR